MNPLSKWLIRISIFCFQVTTMLALVFALKIADALYLASFNLVGYEVMDASILVICMMLFSMGLIMSLFVMYQSFQIRDLKDSIKELKEK